MNDFTKGFFVGLTTCLVAAHLWLGVMLEGTRAMYVEFGGAIPRMTSLVLSSGWRWSVPALGMLALAWLVPRRPRSGVPYVVVAAVLLVTVVVTYHFANAPIDELAGNIKP